MRIAYPSDITREQFEKIQEELEEAKKRTHLGRNDLYDIFCAILYMIKKGAVGEIFHMITPTGRMYVITTIFGQNLMMME